MASVVYFSQTGQTRKFVEKINTRTVVEITPEAFELEMTTPYILVMPSYEANVHPIVIDTAADFLETADNLKHCKGLFGAGNRNFADLFATTAKTLARDYGLPLLHTFEFQGSTLDVEKMEEELSNIEHTN